MRAQSTIMGWRVVRFAPSTGVAAVAEWERILCVDCVAVRSGQPLTFRESIHSYQAPQTCGDCGEPTHGPIHLAPGASGWGPGLDNNNTTTETKEN